MSTIAKEKKGQQRGADKDFIHRHQTLLCLMFEGLTHRRSHRRFRSARKTHKITKLSSGCGGHVKSAKEIMEEIGFKEGASDSAKAAFLQNLIYQAYGTKVKLPEKYKSEEIKNEALQQLTFNMDDAG